MTDTELEYVMVALKELAKNVKEWKEDYDYSIKTNEFTYKSFIVRKSEDYRRWFSFENV